MMGEGFSETINRRCWEEALSVQDLLVPAPPRRTRLEAACDRLLAVVTLPRALARQNAWDLGISLSFRHGARHQT